MDKGSKSALTKCSRKTEGHFAAWTCHFIVQVQTIHHHMGRCPANITAVKTMLFMTLYLKLSWTLSKLPHTTFILSILLGLMVTSQSYIGVTRHRMVRRVQAPPCECSGDTSTHVPAKPHSYPEQECQQSAPECLKHCTTICICSFMPEETFGIFF